nr:MAG TPA: hypothetical protein [Caudoviricetes sp.]
MRKLTAKEINEITEVFKATLVASSTWDSETSFIPTKGTDAGFSVDISDLEVEGAKIRVGLDVYRYNASADRWDGRGYMWFSSSDMVNECRRARGVGDVVQVLGLDE